jgi:hypothetical protein
VIERIFLSTLDVLGIACMPSRHVVLDYAPAADPLICTGRRLDYRPGGSWMHGWSLGVRAEAARELSISTDAVRKRIARGSLESSREDGHVLVWLDDSGTEAGRDAQVDREALLEAKNETIRLLREPPESPETGADMPMGPTPQEASEAAQEPTERVSWWRRLFRG